MSKDNCYRLSIRLNLDDEEQKKLAERLRNLDKRKYGSINNFFIVAASHCLDPPEYPTLEAIREVIHSELQSVSLNISSSQPVSNEIPELTEEQQAENDASVADDLAMFG